ncbi:cation:dicarboxylase symporter family transporter [Neobacillus sp. PS3-34]|uniref:cation:dicarboxylate symporter family transporter n=1 Tax=Neobacillus sp. PS3-34 TaxID=3070678 RepID=UPI0027DEE439|nr:cation:dicarboxylase symporter family transporter [Neobacillus sp. PS3-34]WML50720.1 cation:dicarboxylase symporter family transporter [Neobacillus sp. PS3-34]
MDINTLSSKDLEQDSFESREAQKEGLQTKNLFKSIPFPFWVFITLATGFLLGLFFPHNAFVQTLAKSGEIFPKTIVTFATVIIFFLLSGATIKLITVHKDKAGKLFGRIFLLYLVLGLAALAWAGLFIKVIVGVDFDTKGAHAAGFGTLITGIFGTFKTIITQHPLLQVLVAAVFIGWLASSNKRFVPVANGIMKISDHILGFFKKLLWYYPIMIGCLAINIPLKFGTNGVAAYGKTVLWVMCMALTWTAVMLIVTKLISKRTWKQILSYYITVFSTGFGTGGSYDTLAVNIISAEKDLKLKPEFAETSIVFGTVLNKSTATMAVLIVTVTTCEMMHIPLSFSEILLLVLPLWILGLESPGVPGGAGFFMSPVIALILQVPDPVLFTTTFITMYSGLIPMITTAVNTTDDGLIGAMVEDRFAPMEKEEART